ncbi:unnamed protein product [Pedinophyceae sp. YPF-701]|nr:unnamed protein product [Pedinophyceae sp. YPF-701]
MAHYDEGLGEDDLLYDENYDGADDDMGEPEDEDEDNGRRRRPRDSTNDEFERDLAAMDQDFTDAAPASDARDKPQRAPGNVVDHAGKSLEELIKEKQQAQRNSQQQQQQRRPPPPDRHDRRAAGPPTGHAPPGGPRPRPRPRGRPSLDPPGGLRAAPPGCGPARGAPRAGPGGPRGPTAG